MNPSPTSRFSDQNRLPKHSPRISKYAPALSRLLSKKSEEEQGSGERNCLFLSRKWVFGGSPRRYCEGMRIIVRGIFLDFREKIRGGGFRRISIALVCVESGFRAVEADEKGQADLFGSQYFITEIAELFTRRSFLLESGFRAAVEADGEPLWGNVPATRPIR